MRSLSIVLLTLSLLSCTDASSKATTIGHHQLKTDAIAIVEQWKASNPTDRSIPASFWPESIRQLEPVDVYPHMLGVLVVTEKSDQYHTDIYIVTANDIEEVTNPSTGSGVNYRTLSSGLHQAEIKVRQAAKSDR